MEKKITEQASNYDDIQEMSIADVLQAMNKEDQTVAQTVAQEIPHIERFVKELVPRVKAGGRLFYIGAGTSGRLGILDASECPPTFGVADDVVIGIIAGGDKAIRKAQEFAEDDMEQCWKDLQAFNMSPNDTVLGIASSGTTPYVVGGLKHAQEYGCLTASLCCNPEAPMYAYSTHKISVIVGPEFITGSTRMKAGTAQKLVLNMISTSLMIQLGKIEGNRMVDMQLSNNKLIDRGVKMIKDSLDLDYEKAKLLLLEHGSVREAIAHHKIKSSE